MENQQEYAELKVQKSTTLRDFIVMAFIIGAVMVSAYFAARNDYENKYNSRSEKTKHEVDSLKYVIEIQKFEYNVLADSLDENSGTHFNQIEIINAVKKAIRNEIKQSNEKIYSINDTLLQHYVDSIRATSGFKTRFN